MPGRDESANGNDGDDEGFESSPEKVNMKYKVEVSRGIYTCIMTRYKKNVTNAVIISHKLKL